MPYSWGIESKSRVLEVRPMAANQPRLIRGKGIASRRFCKINIIFGGGQVLCSQLRRSDRSLPTTREQCGAAVRDTAGYVLRCARCFDLLST